MIIAGAGGAAHLAGVIAALQGLDSLLAIVQMPSGVPVGTLAIGPARRTPACSARSSPTRDLTCGDDRRRTGRSTVPRRLAGTKCTRKRNGTLAARGSTTHPAKTMPKPPAALAGSDDSLAPLTLSRLHASMTGAWLVPVSPKTAAADTSRHAASPARVCRPPHGMRFNAVPDWMRLLTPQPLRCARIRCPSPVRRLGGGNRHG